MQMLIIAASLSAASCTLLGSSDSAQGLRYLESPTFKFYGEQSVSINVTGSPVVEIEWIGKSGLSLCNGYYDKKFLDKFAGHIVVLGSKFGICRSLSALYSKLESINAIALLAVTPATVPGRFLYSHDGSRGLLTRYHPLPLFEVSSEDISGVLDSLRAGEVVILESTPNPWQILYESILWIFLWRVLPAAIALFTAVAALEHFIRQDGNHSVSWVVSKTVNGDLTVPETIHMIEATVMGVLTVVYALGTQHCGDTLTMQAVLFFFPCFTGTGFLVSVVTLLQLHEIKGRVDMIDNANMNQPIRSYGLKKIALVSVPTIGFDTAGLIMSTGLVDSYRYFVACAVIVTALQIVVAAFFTHAYYVVVWSKRNASNKHPSKIRFINWLAISAGCMLLHTVAFGFAAYYRTSLSP